MHKLHCDDKFLRVPDPACWLRFGSGGNNGTGGTGPTGPTGGRGSSFLFGNGVPPPMLGNIGDSYIDLNNGNIYVKTGVNTWTFTGNSLKGPTGNTGATGVAGPTGGTGQIGANGENQQANQ